MSKKYIIEGKIYDYSELSYLCQSKINDVRNPFWVHRAFEFILDWIGSGDFINVMTSGSTGIPKTLKLKKTIMISSSQMTVRRFELQKYDNILCCLSPDYIAGMMMIVRALENELNLILAEPASDPLKYVKNQQISFAAMVPNQLYTVLFESPRKEQLSNVKSLLVGGGMISTKIQKAILGLQTRVYQSFGMTETASHVAIRALNGKQTALSYRAIEDNNFNITADGRLIISAPQLQISYLETQDIVKLLNPQEFIWLGRADNVINSGGIKIYPEDIERRIEPVLEGYNYFIHSVKDDVFGEIVTILVEGVNWDDDYKRDLLKSMRELLGKYEIPKSIQTVDQFIYTNSNKINRKATLTNYIS
jgi:O-succinylbenzoic acid--CoA ligase